jgi:hypothetical protein
VPIYNKNIAAILLHLHASQIQPELISPHVNLNVLNLMAINVVVSEVLAAFQMVMCFSWRLDYILVINVQSHVDRFCVTGLAGPVSPLGIYAPTPTAIAAVIKGLENYVNYGLSTDVTTTLNFGLDLPSCNVCDILVSGEWVGEQGLTCEARPGSRLLVTYDLENTCINDSVKIQVRNFTHWIEILVLVKPKNQSNYATLFADKVALSTVGEIILGQYDCENCEFDYECDYSDGASTPIIFVPKLDTIPGTNLPKGSTDKLLPNTDRYVTRRVISAPSELNIHSDAFTPIPDFTPTQLAYFAATNEYTDLARAAEVLPYVANTEFTEPYGITCSCEGCESGYPSNPAFILVAGGPSDNYSPASY